jgi:hypothetical protein
VQRSQAIVIHWLTPQLEVECRLPGLFDEVQQQLVVRQEEIEGGKPLRLPTQHGYRLPIEHRQQGLLLLPSSGLRL